jgi:hypothetical protein
MADQKDAKPSEKGLVPMTQKDMMESMTVIPNMEYLYLIGRIILK